MLRLKRWIAATLAACLLINTIPVYAFAEMDEPTSTVEPASEAAESSSIEQSVSEVIESGSEVTQTTQTSQETKETETQETKSLETENNDPLQETKNIDSAHETQENMEQILEFEETSEETISEILGENEIQLAAEGGIPKVGDTFADSFIDVLNDNNISATIEKGEDGVITLTIGEGQGEILALLSKQTQTQESNYQNWNINFNLTGSLTLPDDYCGLGDKGFPFKGKFTNQRITIKTSNTLFKALDAGADLNENKIEWEIGANDATPTIPILTDVLVADGQVHTVNMPLASANRFNPYIGQLTGGTGQVTLPALNYSSVGTSPAVNFSADIGLVCGSMDDNTNLQVGAVTLPSVSLNLKSSGNVGSLVGSMGAGAKLTITEDLTLNATLNGDNGANAGGLVGSMTNATIDVTEGKNVIVNATLTETEAAGGIAGVVTTETGPLGTNANVVLQSVKVNGTQNSGVLYGTCTATGEFNPLTGVSFGENAVREVSGSGNCGGLFGTLTLNGSGKCILSSAESQTLEITTSLADAANTTAYGGVAGTLTGERVNALVVDNCSITSNINVGTDTVKYPQYLGGIVANQVTENQTAATLDAKNSTITVNSPKTITAADCGFGGVTAYLDDGALLIADGLKVITDSYSANPGGGGVVGSAHKGSIVYLKTRLDLSECQLSTNSNSGQIVGSQDCSLIYAPGVAILRLQTEKYKGMELDDIGNYGELYRISNFLTVDETTYATKLPSIIGTNNKYILSSPQDYACLALAWQSRGYFPTVAEVTNTNWSTLKSSIVTLDNAIDLTGCGIGGLTRDVNSDNDTFSGTFNGNNHTITLDIGAENQANTTNVSKGDGRIYWHNATGLFAVLSSTATVQQLMLKGSVRLSNNKLSPMYSGGLAAQMNGKREDGSTLSRINNEVNFDAKVNGANTLYLGGLIGQISGGTAKIDFDGGTSLASIISISYSGNGSTNHFGGAIGGIAGGASVYITCSGTTIGGSINSADTTVNNLYAGGLIGTIWPATNSSTRNINLTNLTVDGFSLAGNASERMGGILGGIWADTDVTVDGLTVSSVTLTANGAAALGGLVYRASGKWTVSSADLSGLTINASNASALGLLACHGEPYKEPINSTALNTDMNALYLEMAEHWDWNTDTKKGYSVPSTITFQGTVFDEFVAYTAYADRSSDTPNYQITANGSGIISLKTQDGTVHMTEGERNTYVNRTGVSTTTNKYSRYYYNLPAVLDIIKAQVQSSDANRVDTAEELLIWSVNRYAASNLKQYFDFPGVADDEGNVVSSIGGTSSGERATFDMKGLSYYPINITDESVTVQYADVKLYNDVIETKEVADPKNKSTREQTQHYTMHCSLFLNFTAENVTENATHQLTVNGVTFAGTVGVVNGGSGALLCGTVAGKTDSGNTATCTVILANEDNSAKAVSLNGLSVVPEGDYTPVLINKFGSYAGLKANYVTTTQTIIAGSSLIGDVGGENATNVTIAFGGTIKLPEQKSGDGQVFTKATLLNSLRYADGSATYIFVSLKDEGTTHDTTYGYELSESVEYAGKCGYYDDDTDGSKKIPFPEGQTDFKAFLPYVACSPATDKDNYPLSGKWHELAVNIHSDPLTEGCGTYGHPYRVTSKELREAANYINTGVASTSWEVRVPNGDAYHTDDTGDILLTYRNGCWEKEDGSSYTGDVRRHLQSAYYQLVYAEDANGIKETSIILNNFPGIGANPDWAFKGVITGKQSNGSYTKITLTGSSSSFVKYSYGSVVRDVEIQLNQSLSLSHVSPDTTDNITAPQQAPTIFFGGVIGCVMGGDNIIDSVSVSKADAFNVTPTGTNSYLVPMGGYVGVIAGGGVIFRGEISKNTGITGETAQLYRNPIIGRVLGGYAFYEGDENSSAPDNGDKNYTINKLSDDNSPDLNWGENTLTVNNAQGLLILSAIVSSGAGSTESNSYCKGVARNAKYDHIGETANDASSDFALSNSDMTGSVPYLLKQYAGCTALGDICAKSGDTNGIAIKFAENAVFNMTGYGNGYRGLSARYVSNAAFKDSTVTPSVVVLRVKTFDGQNATVQGINMDVEEYADDDFHVASLGGIFNIVWTAKQSGGGGAGSNFAQNLTLTNCNVILKYMNSSGVEQNEADIKTFSNEDGRRAVSVGGFIGMANDVDATQGSINHNYLFSNIHIKGNSSESKCQIYGPNGVGGLIGTTAMASTGVTGYPGILLANNKWALFGPSFLNCSFSNIEVSGGLAAGGLVGDAYANSSTTIPNFSGLGLAYSNGSFKSYTSCTVTENNLIVGQNATITARAKASIAGGLFGGAGMRVGVNDPEVNTKSGITIADATGIHMLQLSNVEIKVSQEDYNAEGSNPDSGVNNAYAAGIIGRIGNVNPSCFYDIHISGGGVTSKLADTSYVGGMQGSGYTNSAISVQRCQIFSFAISGKNAGGLLGSGKTAPGFSLSVSECKLENCTVNGDKCAGGLVGEAASTYNLSNLLLKNTSIKANDPAKAGRLFGLMNFNDAGNDFKVYAAGISVYADDPEVSVPQKEGYDGGKNYIGYISYADYAGTETAVEDEKSPYVTVNPNYMLNGANKLLTGDAVGKIQDDSYNSVAARIWADHQNGATDKKNLASYTKASDIVAEKTVPEVSTFQEVQGYTNEEWGNLADLPVLVLKGNDASVIEDYLNVITNGGYDEANVSPTVSVYYFDKDQQTFSAETDEQKKANPPSIYYESNQFHIRSRTFDNTLNRFSLVEAKFTVEVNGKDRTYTVSVPVVVIRELQFDFMATFSYGKEFFKDTFSNLKTHLLESTGNPFTACLTYQYNREKSQYVEYDWQTYMDDGGSMLNVDKVLNFSSGLPEGTQMILLDCQNGTQAYQYTTVGTNTNDVRLSDFTSLADGTTKFQSSMAQILGVTASENELSGKFVETTGDDPDVTVRIKDTGDNYVYYRLYTETDSDKKRFDLTVPDLSSKAPEENYYLVITVPNQSDPAYYINGSLSSALNWSMPSHGTQLHRYDKTVDDRNNTESTYQISTGYRQEIISMAQSGEAINLGDANQKMQVKVQDTITFSNQQTYGDSDQLFLKFTASLQEHTAGSTDVTEIQFPSGTTGTVHFYVKNTDGQYFTWDGSVWSGKNEKEEAASYSWASQGDNIELILSLDGTTALDLSGVRKIIKGQNNTGDSQIIVTAEMDIDFNGQELLNVTVPGSNQNGADRWAQLHYVGRISTQEFSLDYSSARVATDDNAKYYRAVQYQAILSMDAASINQLGINPLALVPDYLTTYQDNKASRIDLTAALNLANLQDIESVLAETEDITFTLSLQRREGDTYEDVLGASQYVAFDSIEYQSQTSNWSWTIPKEKFYDQGRIVTNDLFDGTQFTMPVTAYVFTDKTGYANYKIKLTVSFGEGSTVAVSDSDAYVVYTFACIKPAFYDPSGM